MSVSIDDLQFLWEEADRKFHEHRGSCSTCQWRPKRGGGARLCATGASLYETAEKLLADLSDARGGS